jgi:hypothetical protein
MNAKWSENNIFDSFMSSFGQCFANKYGLKRNGKKHAEM